MIAEIARLFQRVFYPTGGEIYDDTVRNITGQSLYQRWIPNETVAIMYQKLMSCCLEEYPGREDIENLRKLQLKR